MDIHLFLAHADDHEPVLRDGVPLERLLEAPTDESHGPTRKRIFNLDGSPDDLRTQQWALVAPQGSLGDRLLSLVEPLRRKREEEQGRKALVYRVDPGMDAVATAHWAQGAYRDAVGKIEANRPRYLLILGGPDLVSWDFQQMLGGEAFVGRIAFDLDEHYEAYVDKLVRVFAQPEHARAQALFHAVLDGSRATQEGHKHLVVPTLEWAQAALKNGSFDVGNLQDVPMSPGGSSLDPTTAAGALLRESALTRAGLLFSMSHGAGEPKEGWKSAEEQRRFQGAMVLGRKGDLLTANDIADVPFLPGGMWFMFACHGAGTPSRSAYFPWLSRLHSLGFLSKAATNVLGSLPLNGEKPFVAALPQAALANPLGPLGFLGHVDLAWSWSFLDYEIATSGFAQKSRAERFQSILRAFGNGHRFGVAHHELLAFFRAVNTGITAMEDERAQQLTANPAFVEDRATQIRRANLWMQRNDLSAYVLLGDPAARLPIQRCPPGLSVGPAQPRIEVTSEEVSDRIDAVLAILQGTTTPEDVARRRKTTPDEVETWVETFVEGGRRALMKQASKA